MNIANESADSPTTIEDDDSNENFYQKQLLRLTTVASTTSIIANILISLTIIKYKHLRKSVTNIIILHIVLVQIISLVLDEVLLWFFTDFGTGLHGYHTEFCVFYVGIRLMNSISYLFMVLLVWNWYFKLYSNENQYSRFCKCYKFLLVLVYFVAVLVFPFLTKLCLRHDIYTTFYIVVAVEIVMTVFSVYMNVLGKLKSRSSFDNDVGLGVVNVAILVCSPSYCVLFLSFLNLVPTYVITFADVLVAGVFPFVLVYMYKSDKNFQMYFKRLFTCSNGDLENGSVSYNLIHRVET